MCDSNLLDKIVGSHSKINVVNIAIKINNRLVFITSIYLLGTKAYTM